MGSRAEERVTVAWALRLPASAAAHAAALRLEAHVRGCAAPDGFWLCGERSEPRLRRLLQQLPGGEPFERLADGRVVRPGGRVPAATWPDGPWSPLAGHFPVGMPTPALPAAAVPAVGLRLVRGPVDEGWAAGVPALATTLAALLTWCERAAELRCRGLVFAAADDGSVFVVGAPLPSVPGASCVVVAGVALPAGHVPAPACAPELVRAHLGLGEGDIAWFQPDGRCRVLPASAFVPLSRGAVRATAAEMLP